MNQFHTDALRIIRSTRTVSLPNWGTAEITAQKSEGAHDVVTKLDTDIERYLKTEFEKLDPSISFVGEEFGGDRNAKKKWLVDPIDGTAHFIRGTPFCTTMVALIEDEKVIFSAIYDFIQDVMYQAVLGEGAFQEDKPIHVSERSLREAYISYESNLGTQDNLLKYLGFRKQVGSIQLLCSGFEFVQVALGKIEGRICVDPYGKDWDFAPGSLLVSEAGGIVTNIGSSTYDYRNVNLLATNKKVYEALTSGPDALFPHTQKD